MLVLFPIIIAFMDENNQSLSMMIVFVLVFFALVVALIFYEVYFIKKQGATPGKKAVGIKVVKEDGSEISWGDSIVRYLIKSLGTNIYVLYLGSLWIIWDKKKQGWHDKAARTVVINKP